MADPIIESTATPSLDRPHGGFTKAYLQQIAQAELVTQPPEHHQGDDVGRVLRPVQHGLGLLVELLVAGVTAEAAVTLSRALVR
jgi:hypothetical protein